MLFQTFRTLLFLVLLLLSPKASDSVSLRAWQDPVDPDLIRVEVHNQGKALLKWDWALYTLGWNITLKNQRNPEESFRAIDNRYMTKKVYNWPLELKPGFRHSFQLDLKSGNWLFQPATNRSHPPTSTLDPGTYLLRIEPSHAQMPPSTSLPIKF